MGKGGENGGRVCSLYIEYIIKEYKGKQRCEAKGKESGVKGKCGKECSSFVYRYSIIERKEKGGAKIVYVYLRSNICSLYIDIQNARTNKNVYFQRTYVRYIIRSNVYLLYARLCVLSAQHMNTRSYNVYAEKHMFDFYNKFL